MSGKSVVLAGALRHVCLNVRVGCAGTLRWLVCG